MEPNTLIALAAAGGIFCLGFLLLGNGQSKGDLRVKKLSGQGSAESGFLAKLKVEDGGNRRKQLEETLGKIEERQKTKKKKAKALPAKLIQADWNRGVRTGLPLGDCLKIIAHESPDPLGAEFRRVVEGESIGIPLEVCLEQMYERMPISEVNFFSTVLNIQKTTGGNLGESLANLASVLRGRKLLREKIKALSAEAKMSAIIIGVLPVAVGGLVTCRIISNVPKCGVPRRDTFGRCHTLHNFCADVARR